MRRWDSHDFPRSRLRQARGGIKAQSQRGAFAKNWWAKRWIKVLDSFSLGTRMSRGRAYARSGQVLSVKVEKGEIAARVQGSRSLPYDVRIEVKTLSKADWTKVADAATSQMVFASKLLSGEMPVEIEELCLNAGVALFPERYNDLETHCSCPDDANPCKHIAAVYYLLGEEFDRDPFLIFKMRGMTREEFLNLLGQAAPANVPPPEVQKPEPLPVSPVDFWQLGDLPADLIAAPAAGHRAASLAGRLGKFPFWSGQYNLGDFLTSVYGFAALDAADALAGRREIVAKPASEPVRKQRQAILPAVLESISHAWPHQIIGESQPGESYLAEIYPGLQAALMRLRETEVYERVSNPDLHRSYKIFLLSPQDSAFTFEAEGSTDAYRGLVVSISAIAPYAAITFGERASFADGSRWEPDISADDGEPAFRETLTPKNREALDQLRTRITAVLSKNSIEVVPLEDLIKPLREYRAADGVLTALEDRLIVMDALFFSK